MLDLIRTIRDLELPIILISHNLPHVFEIADHIHLQEVWRRVALTSPSRHTMHEAVAIMTGAVYAPNA